MSQTCTTVEYCDVLVEGTGTYVEGYAENWDGLAFQNFPPFNINGVWRYAFDPVEGSVFFTGVYDLGEYALPRPNRYKFAIEFRLNEYRVHYGATESSWLAWAAGERLSMQGESGTFRVFKDDVETWSS